jgi:guanylate cyclase
MSLEQQIFERLHQLEERLALPGDSDTVRKQKVAALFAGIAGMALSFFAATMHYLAGSPDTACYFVALGLFMIFPIVLLPLYPQHYYSLVFITAVIVTLHPWLVHFATGGFQSGLMQGIWSLFGPISCLLLVGIWPATVCGLMLVICAAAAAIVDPLVAGAAPQFDPAIRRFLGFFNIVALSAMIFIPTVYVFRRMELARAQADDLLLNVLPEPIAAKLKLRQDIIAEGYQEVTVLFADIVDFTHISANADPAQVVGLLNDIFSEFDDLADRYGLEKIKTIGDAYMVAGGLPLPRKDHCQAVTAFAIDILEVVKKYRGWRGEPICLRVGVNTGPVVAGVIGHRKFIYDLWGDVVNTASRMESQGVESYIQVTAEVKEKLNGQYEFKERPPIPVKGKGEMITYLLAPPEKEAIA